MSKRFSGLTKAQEAEADLALRRMAANSDLLALCSRHRVVLTVEQGQSSSLGAFTRIMFMDAPPSSPTLVKEPV